jgi:predicted transcriptional regulator
MDKFLQLGEQGRAENSVHVFYKLLIVLDLRRYFPILRDLGECVTLAKDWRREFGMSSLAEIQEAIEKLASEDRARLREWFDAQDVEETDELLAAIDEGIRSAETERNFSLEEVRAEIKKWATKSA